MFLKSRKSIGRVIEIRRGKSYVPGNRRKYDRGLGPISDCTVKDGPSEEVPV